MRIPCLKPTAVILALGAALTPIVGAAQQGPTERPSRQHSFVRGSDTLRSLRSRFTLRAKAIQSFLSGQSRANAPTRDDLKRAAAIIVDQAAQDLFGNGKISVSEYAALTGNEKDKPAYPSEPEDVSHTFQIGGTISNSITGGGGTGGGLVPAYSLSTNAYSLLFALNFTTGKTVGNSSSGSTPAADAASSASSITSGQGALLLNPGSSALGVNFLGIWYFSPPTGLYDRLIEGIAGEFDARSTAQGDLKAALDLVASSVPGTSVVTNRRHRHSLGVLTLDLAERATVADEQDKGVAPQPAPAPTDEVVKIPRGNIKGVWGLYSRLGVAFLDFAGSNSAADATNKTTASGGVFSPAVGLQYMLGDYTDDTKIHFGFQVGATARLIFGDITQGSNMILRRNLIEHTQFFSPEVTGFVSYKNIRPYVRWTNMNGAVPGLSGSQVVFGADLFASF
jgi:hypothetical protein